MNCCECKTELTDGEEPLSDEAEAHLEDCPACRTLAEDEGRLADALDAAGPLADGGGPDLDFDDLRDEIDEQSGPLDAFRESSRTVRTAVVAAVALLVTAGVFWTMPRADLAAYPTLRFWGLGAGFFGLSTGAFTIAYRPVYQPGLTSRGLWSGLALLVGAAVLSSLMPFPHTVEPFYSAGLGNELIPAALTCFTGGSIFALPVAAVGWMAVRSTRPFLYRTLLLAAGTGIVGHLALHLHCPLVQPAHLLLGHATIPVAYTAVCGLAIYTLDRIGDG
jgi:hypothetical protein